VTEPDLRAVVIAGHRGDAETVRAGLTSADPGVRAAALGALERLGALDADTITAAFGDAEMAVRRRAAELAARHPSVDLLAVLDDPDDRVVEVAAWACGEHESRRDAIVERLVEPPNAGAQIKFFDLTMFVMPGGRERTREEYTSLLETAGFRVVNVSAPGADNFSAIEAVAS
jgi:hypothetical protein